MKEPKIGDEYFRLFIDDQTGDHDWWIYRVRSIMNRNVTPKHWTFMKPIIVRYVYAIHVASWTWGKRSTKAGDYGWLDPISDDWREKWKADEKPRDLFRTKKEAIKAELASFEVDNYDEPEIADKIFKKLENMLRRA